MARNIAALICGASAFLLQLISKSESLLQGKESLFAVRDFELGL